MNISDNGLNLIKQFEGFSAKAYKDSVGIYTLGYGTITYPDGTKVKENDVCSESEAQEWLRNYMANAINWLNNIAFKTPLSQNQFDALCSFIYNLGAGALSTSTLLRKAKVDPDDESIYKYDKDNPVDSCEFTKWCRAGGNVIKGLIFRRMKEADLYGKQII